MTKAIRIVSRGEHDPHLAHERIKDFYDWSQVAQRTEVVYERVMSSKPYELWERIKRCISRSILWHFNLLGIANDESVYQYTLTWTRCWANIHHHTHR